MGAETMKTNPIELAQAKFADLTKIIEEADRVRPQWIELQDFLQKAKKLFPEYFDAESETSTPVISDPDTNISRPVPTIPATGTLFDTERRRRNPTSRMATKIFKERGPLDTAVLLSYLYQDGWKGSNDTDRDLRAVYNALSLHPELFTNLGKGTWALRPDAGSGQP
jgi:hypothetical protein